MLTTTRGVVLYSILIYKVFIVYLLYLSIKYNNIHMKTFYTLLISVLFILSSCMTTSTTVGDYKEDSGKQYTYAKGKQFWIGFGLFPIGRTDVQTPTDGSCEVMSKFTFGDFLISGITGGIVSSRTIIVKDKEN